MSERKQRTIVPRDQDGRYDMDGASYDSQLGVILGSDATSASKDRSRLDDLNVVETSVWRRWLSKWLAHRT